MAVLVLLIGGTSLYQMYNMQKNTGNIVEESIPALNQIHDINYYTEHVMALSMQHILNTDSAEKAKLEEQRVEVIRTVAEAMKLYRESLAGERGLEQLSALSDKWGNS